MLILVVRRISNLKFSEILYLLFLLIFIKKISPNYCIKGNKYVLYNKIILIKQT